MPKQKDLKRLIRTRMKKTGEAYTAARIHLVQKPAPDYAAVAGLSDASVTKATGRTWTQWVNLLDREKGQRRGGAHEAGKSRTFNVPVSTLFDAFANARQRRKWLPVKIAVRSVTPQKRMRITWEDDTVVVLEFLSKGSAKSVVALGHQKLPSKSAADAMKKTWSEHLDRLGEFLS